MRHAPSKSMVVHPRPEAHKLPNLRCEHLFRAVPSSASAFHNVRDRSLPSEITWAGKLVPEVQGHFHLLRPPWMKTGKSPVSLLC
jgi:hypothetical protein